MGTGRRGKGWRWLDLLEFSYPMKTRSLKGFVLIPPAPPPALPPGATKSFLDFLEKRKEEARREGTVMVVWVEGYALRMNVEREFHISEQRPVVEGCLHEYTLSGRGRWK